MTKRTVLLKIHTDYDVKCEWFPVMGKERSVLRSTKEQEMRMMTKRAVLLTTNEEAVIMMTEMVNGFV